MTERWAGGSPAQHFEGTEMTENQKTGAAVSDVLAANAAAHRLADQIGAHAAAVESHDAAMHTAALIVRDYDVTWETGVNEVGVPVRRPVLRGEWEVDPAPPVHLPRKGDVVMFLPEHDEDVYTVGSDPVPAGSEWVVRAVPSVRPGKSALLFIAQPEWPEAASVNVISKLVRIVRRAS